ncbi:MAG: 3-isopropylmalate dehydratase [Polyangiaceae bacterium]|nr:3-isopropylmalate dehydratase [Polyangiaceae bacterium]
MDGRVTEHRVRVVPGVISTDDIIPGRYKHMYTDPRDMAPHVFESLLPGFAASLRKGDALYCHDLFGIGSSREQAVSSLMAAGVTAIFARRFGRIFFRNAWNLGLPVIELRDCDLAEEEPISVDLERGVLQRSTGPVAFEPPPPQMLQMLRAGGLLASVAARVRADRLPAGGETGP